MSKTRYKWWGYVKAVIRAYPDHCAALASMREQTMTAAYDVTPRGGGPGKPVEALALRTLPREDQREYEAVMAAAQETKRLQDGADRMKLIGLVFWKQTHTLEGAAQACNVSYKTACRWHNAYIRAVAGELGLIEKSWP